MPIYDFVCNSCGERFETLVLGKAAPTCPKCQGQDLSKQMSTFAFRTGGGGSTPDGGGASSGSGSKCSGCAGKSCSTC